MDLFRKKLTPADSHSHLVRCLSAFDLTLLGIGAIIGAGIFILTGIAAATKAGPAVVVSYLLAGLVATFSALSYAELAASLGGCGSAYGYAYAGFGEFIAWIIGWDLLLEYGISCSAVAIGWSGYVNNILQAVNIHLPLQLLNGPYEGGIVNLPAVLIILIVASFLAIGVRLSAQFNLAIVTIKIIAITVFVAIACFHVQPHLWQPFMPMGWTGVLNGAALVFFAYIGFDALSTAAEEALQPQHDLPIGIITSLTICTVIYILVSGLLTLIAPYQALNVSSPVADVLLKLGYRLGSAIVAAGAIAGLTSVILVMYYGLTRIFLAMSRDGLLLPFFSVVNKKTHTPVRLILTVGIINAIIAGISPITKVAELVNIGTLVAFALVCAGVIALRYRRPDLPRPFKLPFNPLTPALGVISSIILILHLNYLTWIRFVVWMFIGLIIYFSYSYRHSDLSKV